MTSRAAGTHALWGLGREQGCASPGRPGRSVGGRAYSLATWGVNRMYSVYVLGYLGTLVGQEKRTGHPRRPAGDSAHAPPLPAGDRLRFGVLAPTLDLLQCRMCV